MLYLSDAVANSTEEFARTITVQVRYKISLLVVFHSESRIAELTRCARTVRNDAAVRRAYTRHIL